MAVPRARSRMIQRQIMTTRSAATSTRTTPANGRLRRPSAAGESRRSMGLGTRAHTQKNHPTPDHDAAVGGDEHEDDTGQWKVEAAERGGRIAKIDAAEQKRQH